MTDAELVELLLTYAIPRRDVAHLAKELLARFGTVGQLLGRERDTLLAVDGIGEQTATLLVLVGRLAECRLGQEKPAETTPLPMEAHTSNFSAERARNDFLAELIDEPESKEPSLPGIRTFANDEIANSLALLPEAPRFAQVEAFRTFLHQRLPYNSESTRRRRASYIMDRFFPTPQTQRTLIHFLAQKEVAPRSLQDVIFYHILRAEPLAAHIADNCIWPALPTGRIEREEMRRSILTLLPELSKSSQANALRSLFNSYNLLGVGQESGTSLFFRTRTGSLDSFVYLLLAHCPTPGIYSFELLEQGPPGRWLLWDRQWMRSQLYNLRDLGILAKVSEIDTIRQFSLVFDQMEGLSRFFAIPQDQRLALREREQ